MKMKVSKCGYHYRHDSGYLVKESNNLAGNVLSPGLLVVHNTSRGGKDNVTELTGREKLHNPLLKVGELDVVAG